MLHTRVDRYTKLFTYLAFSAILMTFTLLPVAVNALTPMPGCYAGDDTFTFAENQLSSNVFSGSVAGNDVRFDSATGNGYVNTGKYYERTTAGGSVTLAMGGAFEYTPPEHYVGDDSFSYDLYWKDAQTKPVDPCATALVTLHVTAPNYVRIAAQNDYATTNDLTAITVDPLLNDRYVRTAFQSTFVASYENLTPGLGAFSIGQNSVTYYPVFTFTPARYQSGTAILRYTLSDYTGASSTAYVYIALTHQNLAPTANDDNYTVSEDMVLTGEVFGNDSDPEGTSITVGSYTQPNTGSVVVNPDGTFRYTPAANYWGADSFTYTISDGTLTDTATVNIVIDSVNDVPVASFTATRTRAKVYTFNASSTYDVDGPISSFAWNFGDGTSANSVTSTIKHTYKKPGTYTVTLTAVDPYGAIASYQQVLLVK